MKKFFYFVLLTLLFSGCCKKDKGDFSLKTTPRSVEVSDGTCVITYGMDLKDDLIFYPVSLLLSDSTLILL